MAQAKIRTADIVDGQVTLAKQANIATSTLIGRATAGTGVPEAITIGDGLTLTGSTLSATGGSSKWTDVGTDSIYRNSNVIIGSTIDPTARLHVRGILDSTAATVLFRVENNSTANGPLSIFRIQQDGNFFFNNGSSGAIMYSTGGDTVFIPNLGVGSITITGGVLTVNTIRGTDWNTNQIQLNNLWRVKYQSSGDGGGDYSAHEFFTAAVMTGTNSKLVSWRNGPENTAELAYIKKGGELVLTKLATGVTAPVTTGTTKMVVTDANGLLSYADIPGAGGGGGVTSLSAIGSTPNANGATITGTVLNLEPANASFGGIVTVDGQSFAGFKIFTEGLSTNANLSNANFTIASALGINNTNESTLLFGASANIDYRISERGSTNGTLNINNSYSSHVIGTQVITEAASGTHPIVTQLAIKPLSITAGAALTTNSSSLYIEGAATGAVNNYSLWVDNGTTKLDGDVILDSLSPNSSTKYLVLNVTSKKIELASAEAALGNPTTDGYILSSTIAGVRTWIAPPAGGSGSGITRSILNISTATTAGATVSTDYVYNATGTFTITMPTAVGNTNRYTFKNKGTGIITIIGTAAQTLDEGTSATLTRKNSAIELISDGSNWNIY